MVISACIKLNLVALLACAYPLPTWAGCSDIFSGYFFVLDWEGDEPKSASLSRYEKGSGFLSPNETYSLDYTGEKVTSSYGRTALKVVFKDHEILSHNYDYRLIINRKIEYKIYGITPTNKGTWGCPLASAKVNSCKAIANSGIQFESKCGNLLND
ncbi:hypothetical protein [Chitinimonas taiwanensis]|uniref:hypothetical protein n=1 Tax=Chitinimonas taiwanensis TaxID=240412 RepID=UPI001114F3A3|nr:hypothetical protein [Chitinimonas taiwanensis]